MIVSCPSCGTLYRHAAMHAVALAQCSCCAGTVPIAARRQYALRSAPRSDTLVERGDLTRSPLPFAAQRPAAMAQAPAALMVGLDDPALAPRLKATAFEAASPEAGPAAAMTWSVVAETRTAPPAAASRPEAAPSVGGTDRIPSPRREGVMAPMLIGAAVGSLAGVAGAAWWGGAELAWWSGASLAGAVLGFGMRKAWTSRNH